MLYPIPQSFASLSSIQYPYDRTQNISLMSSGGGCLCSSFCVFSSVNEPKNFQSPSYFRDQAHRLLFSFLAKYNHSRFFSSAKLIVFPYVVCCLFFMLSTRCRNGKRQNGTQKRHWLQTRTQKLCFFCFVSCFLSVAQTDSPASFKASWLAATVKHTDEWCLSRIFWLSCRQIPQPACAAVCRVRQRAHISSFLCLFLVHSWKMKFCGLSSPFSEHTTVSNRTTARTRLVFLVWVAGCFDYATNQPTCGNIVSWAASWTARCPKSMWSLLLQCSGLLFGFCLLAVLVKVHLRARRHSRTLGPYIGESIWSAVLFCFLATPHIFGVFICTRHDFWSNWMCL